MKLSVIIPCKNEAQNLTILIPEIITAMHHRDYEILIVDDGSTDAIASVLADLAKLDNAPPLRLIRHNRSAGKSAAVRSGLWAAQGEIALTIDGDGQNNPIYLPLLADALINGGPKVAIAAGQRLRRTDTKLKQYSSKLANALRQAILKDGTRDTGCGLKALYTEIFRRLPFFDGCHRFLPALIVREGYKVVHLDVIDRNRVYGQSNYGIMDRATKGIMDLTGVWWLNRRRKVLPVITEVSVGDKN